MDTGVDSAPLVSPEWGEQGEEEGGSPEGRMELTKQPDTLCCCGSFISS